MRLNGISYLECSNYAWALTFSYRNLNIVFRLLYISVGLHVWVAVSRSNLLFIENSTSVSFLSLKNWRLVKLKEFCELIVGNYSKCFIGELNFHEIKNLKILLSIIQWIVFLAWLQFNQWGMQNCSLFLWRAHHFLLEIAKATCAP